MFLEKIDDTNDLKKLNRKELKELANEVRAALINKISKAGGHSGPNLGMVEMTVALHYVFDSPNDKFVFDVSHQSYPHKILTGRKTIILFPNITIGNSYREIFHSFFVQKSRYDSLDFLFVKSYLFEAIGILVFFA